MHSASRQEIEALIAKYPYCQNLYYQLLHKSSKTEDTAQEEILTKVSMYATDREFLFQYVNSPADNENTETVESIDEADLGFDMVSGSDQAYSGDELDDELDGDFLDSSSYYEESVSDTPDEYTPFAGPNRLMPEEDAANGQSFLEMIIEASEPIADVFRLSEQQIKFLVSYSKLQEENPEQEEISVPIPKTEQDLVPKSIRKAKLPLSKQQQLSQEPDDDKHQSNEEQAEQHEEDVHEIVVRSISENQDIASETLAEVLVSQQQYQKALQMYERLILIFPEKSSFFADKIEHLKKIM